MSNERFIGKLRRCYVQILGYLDMVYGLTMVSAISLWWPAQWLAMWWGGLPHGHLRERYDTSLEPSVGVLTWHNWRPSVSWYPCVSYPGASCTSHDAHVWTPWQFSHWVKFCWHMMNMRTLSSVLLALFVEKPGLTGDSLHTVTVIAWRFLCC